MEVAIPPVGDAFRPSTAGTVLGSTGSSVFGAPTPPSEKRLNFDDHDGLGKFSPRGRASSARGGRRLATLSGAPSPRNAIVPVPRPGHTVGVPRQISSRGSSRGSARRPRLPGLGLASSSTELRWLAKVTPETAEDLIKLHVTNRQRLDVLASERQARQQRLKELQDEYLGAHRAAHLDEKTLDGEKTRLRILQMNLKKCMANQKDAQKDTGKLQVMLRRTKKEWVSGMAQMQDIGQYANEQIQGLFRGSQWRMYNELLREAAAFNLTSMHAESKDLEREREVQIATRRNELEVLKELEQALLSGREEADRERERREKRRVETQAKTIKAKDVKLTLSELQRATDITTKVEQATHRLSKHGHRFADSSKPGHTILDAVFDEMQHQKVLRAEASQAKDESAEKVSRLAAELESLEAQLAQSAIPIETPEPDVDECGNLSPRALGHEGSVRTILARQQQIQRQLNARNVLLPSLEAHATEVIQWFKRLSPKFEPFDVYRKVLGEEVKAMTPTGIEITPAGQVSCWLKSIAATLDWVKLEVKKYRAELGREELDWQAFNAHGMAAVEEGKVIFVTPELNRRVLTEEQETQRQADFRLKEIEEETKATVAAEKLEANGGITISKGDKLEAYRAAAEEAELEARIAEQIKMEKKLDTMGVDEANHYSRELVRVVRDSYLEEEKEVDLARQKAEKERRRRRRVAGRSPLGSGR